MTTNLSVRFIRFILFATFSFVLLSCQIEDEHGTIQFLLEEGGYVSNHGELIYENNELGRFFIDEHTNEIYFPAFNFKDYIVEIRSINYTTNKGKILFTISDPAISFEIIDYNSLNKILLYTKYVQGIGTNQIFKYEISTGKNELIIDNNDFNVDQIQTSNDYIFSNGDYDSLFIYKADFDGNVEKLNIKGEALFASKVTSQIIVYNFRLDRIVNYDYLNDSIISEKMGADALADAYFDSDQGIISFKNFRQPSLSFFDSEKIIFNKAIYDHRADFSANCNMLLHSQENRIGVYGRFMEEQSLILEDITSGEYFETVKIVDQYLVHYNLLNDCNTIIYSTNSKIYKSTIE